MNKLVRIWHTIKYLKLIQLYYQLRIRLIPNTQPKQFSSIKTIKRFPLVLTNTGITLTPSLRGLDNFSFLNIEHTFNNNIDWNISTYGKLWTYNLTYFEFLNQDETGKEYGLQLINDFIDKLDAIKDGNEPYPTSLRCINWIKFISNNDINDRDIDMSLFSQYNYLLENLEYHLLGNHLLENGFSLLLGSYYLKNEKFYKKAKSLLLNQLEEQVLTDGGHFELSPMYHKILLFRVLDSINVINNNPWKQDALLGFLNSKAQLMLGWLETMTYSNGQTANVNDSTNGIAPSTYELTNYAKKLGLSWNAQTLGTSGYRIFKKGNFEVLVDIGNIGPDYIPGHAHADTFNFELVTDGIPIIVDTGISTYEKNNKRHIERSTFSHNTVLLEEQNQSDVWGGFRVGKRAKITSLKETKNFVKASHNGYKNLGLEHSRSFQVEENIVTISDSLKGNPSLKHHPKATFHFHPNIKAKLINASIIINDTALEIQFSNAEKIKLENYNYCNGFNQTLISQMAVVEFTDSLTTTISLNR